MSLPPQVNKAVKHPPAQRPPVHQSEVYYGLGPSLDPGLSDLSAGTSGLYNPEKAAPNLGLYQQQQPPQTKWMQQQDVSAEGTGWPQEAQWGQSFPSYTGGVNMRGFHHKEGLTMGALNQMQDVFRDNMQWEPMHQLQSYQHQQQQQQQQHSQTFPAFPAFRQNKPQQPQFNPGYYTEFVQKQGPVPGMGYVETNKQQMHQIQQQQQQQMHLHQQQQQQQQQLQMQQHCQQRQLQTQYHHQHIHINQPTMQQEVTPKLHFASFQSREQPETKIEAITDEPPQEQREEVVVKETLSESGGEGVLCSVPAAAAESAPNPRRSRRLSRDSVEQGQNGLGQGAPGGVIQSTRTQRRRASKEINLETLAQQAAQREALPPNAKEDVSSVPLVIPVSVPVPRLHQQGDTEGGWGSGRPRTSERCGGPSHKPSVIVARRRSLRNTVPERTAQKGEGDSGTDEEGKPRAKRRPRPEPLIIPPPRPSSFIPPSVYSSITPYQSHLRSPVHPLDHPVMLPPYTPPPILSPVRAGSGLYFSTFLSNMAAAGTQVLPPPPTKSVSVSLLRLASSEITPPQAVVTDATPVSLEPRINVGHQYQAGIPELLGPGASQLDQHRADLLWLPLETEIKHGGHDSVRDLMKLSCSSVLKGGGTNQELLLHCLFQSGGDVLKTLERLMLQDVLFPKGHPLSNYHYSGSDFWTAEEKRYFNKGISAYRKDFIMVQKLVQTKTVAQCVEFYYTYKKQVKVGRSGALTFGPADLVQHSHEELIDNKSSLRVDQSQAELNHQPEPSKPSVESLHQSLQAHDYAASRIDPEPVMSQPLRRPSPPPRPFSEPQAKTAKAPPKPAADPDQVFPCKKCDRVFYKVKSRSAHMKSHAEQEKKAAALRLKQQEEQARMRTLPEPGSRMGPRRAEDRAHASGLYREQGSGSSEADDAEDEDWH